MTRETKNIIAYTAPFAIWIGLQSLLPATAATYAVRSAATLVALLVVFLPLARRGRLPGTTAPDTGDARPLTQTLRACAFGLFGGLLVFALWVGPEHWVPASAAAWYRTWCCWPLGSLPAPTTDPSPYDPAICGWTLTLAKLVGSAFIIAPAEEIFFRSFLYRWLQQQRDFLAVPRTQFDLSAFLWMILLFTLEHDRPLAAALAGAVYGLLYIRCGLFAAIVAHMLTNLLLALYVIHFGIWNFW